MAFRAGYVGLLGLPNAGKSSFLNFLLGEHLCIVSRKPQATRRRMRGLWTTDQEQIIFVDAPGFLDKPSNSLTEYISQEAKSVIADVEAFLVLVPADLKNAEDMEPLIRAVEKTHKPWSFVLSKVDLPLSPAASQVRDELAKKAIPGFGVTVKKQKPADIERFLKELAAHLPESPAPLFDPELFTLEVTRDIASEMIREACFELLAKEVPYGLGVRIEKYGEEEGKILRIEATLLVEKENHKGIVIGSKGSMLKKIGENARKRIEKMLGQKIFLGLHVKHKPDWTKNSGVMKELGYESE